MGGRTGPGQGKEKGRVNPSFGRKGMQARDSARPGPEGGRIEPAEPEPPPALFICKVGQGMQGVVCAAGVQNHTQENTSILETTSTTTIP